jgi:hypothetical protein
VGYRQEWPPKRPPRPEDYGWTTDNGADDGSWAADSGAGRTYVPETGRWSTTHNRWVPQQRPPDGDDFAIGRFEDTGDISRQLASPGQGRVLDHDDWYEVSDATAGWHAAATTPYPTDNQPRDTYRPNTRRPPDQPVYRDRPPGWGAIEPRRPIYRPGYDSYRRRYPPGSTGEFRRPRSEPPRQPPRLSGRDQRAIGWELDDDEREGGGYFATMMATITWYLLPLFAYVGWALLLNESPQVSCVTDAGGPCVGPRMEALQRLIDALPKIGVAVGASIVIGLLLRWAANGWRSMAIGFAAAVVGGGGTTVLLAVLTAH